jgi:predicted transcriptional regulator
MMRMHAPDLKLLFRGTERAITVTLSTALDKAYYLFTHLGLGMLVVTDDSNRLQGILTREHFKTVLQR